MSTSTSTSKRRSIVPGALVVAGLVGLGIAAASELDLVWGGTFQAGEVEVQADCQLDGQQIGVAFSSPEFDGGSDIPWNTHEVVFSNISEECSNLTFEAAYRTTANDVTPEWQPLGSGVVGDAQNEDGDLLVNLGGVDDTQTITGFALTIHGDGSEG